MEELQDRYREGLRLALASVKRPGTFSCGGSLRSFSLPGLEVPKVGPIGVPLTSQQAEALASQARIGARSATDGDRLRGCLQLLPGQFSLAGLGWKTQVNKLVDERVKPGLCLPRSSRVVPRLNKLLLFDAGGCSESYQWAKKKSAEDSFGTLMMVLPAAHSGGKLVVHYAGLESTFNFAARDGLYDLHYAAFFADCEPEILFVRAGCLLALFYDLTTQPADNSEAVIAIRDLISNWSQDICGPQKIVIPLEHKYFDTSLSFEGLEGTDVATIDALLQASKIPGGQIFYTYVGLLQECSSRYQQDRFPLMELTHVKGCGGGPDWYHRSEVNLGELLSNATTSPADDEELEWRDEFHTVPLPSKAAAVIWPHTRRWEVRSCNSPETALAEASSLSRIVVALPRLLEAACLTSGHFTPGEAQTVANLVLEHGQVYAVTELSLALKALAVHAADRLTGPRFRTLVRLIIIHGDLELAKAFLQAYASPAYERGIVAALGSHFGWRKLRPLIVRAVLRAFSRPFERGLLLVLELAPPQQESIQDRAGIAVSGTVTDAKEGALDKPSPGDENRGGKASEQANTERAEVARQALQAVVTEICAEEGDTVPVYGGREPKFALGNARVPMEYLQVVARFGWDACAPATETLVRKFVASPQSAVEFLAILATAFEKPERAAELEPKQRSLSLVAARFNAYFASELVDALHSEDESPQEMWMSPPSPRSLDFVYSLMLALNRLAFSAEKMVAVVSHFFATPKLYDLDKTLLPAVDSLLESLGSGYKGSPWFLKLYWGCLDALESRCLKPPQLDIWVLPAASACACWGCRILVQFCMDPLRVELQLRCPGRDAKQHLIDCVQRYRMPIVVRNKESALEGDHEPLFCIKEGAEEGFDQGILVRRYQLQE